MKFLKNYRFWTLFLVIPFLLMCMEILEVIHPDPALVDSEIEIVVKIKQTLETDDNTKVVFGILAPRVWRISEMARVTLSTQGYLPGDVTNEAMSLIPSTDLNPSDALPWSSSFQSEYGLGGNYGSMEWVMFESATTFLLDDNAKEDYVIEGTFNIKFKTGSDNMKVFMGYAFCGKTNGFDGDKYKENVTFKELEVTGGNNRPIDYTKAPLVSTVPTVYGYGDIFSIVFQEEVDDRVTELKGTDQAYLWGRVIYDGGQQKIMSLKNNKTKMEKIGDITWQKYIYPRDFFDLPENAQIEEIYVHFTNSDESAVVLDEDGDDFPIDEVAE